MFQFLRGSALIAAMMLNYEASLAADVSTANYVMAGCRGFLQTPIQTRLEAGYCAGAVRALVYAAPGVCAPPYGTNEQGVRVVVQYIDSRPARLHENFMDLALEALKAAWPCKN